MEQQILESRTSVQENLDSKVKTKTSDETTQKLPFKDTTNSTEKCNEAAEQKNLLFKKGTCEKPQEYSDDIDVNEFNFPRNQACFCCGENRKLDGEILFQNLISAGFLDLLDSHLRIPERMDDSDESDIDIGYEPDLDITKISSSSISVYVPEEINIEEMSLPMPEIDFDYPSSP